MQLTKVQYLTSLNLQTIGISAKPLGSKNSLHHFGRLRARMHASKSC